MIYYVDQRAEINGDGSAEHPFKCIGDAAKLAQHGDQVLVAPGVYREYVDPKHGGREDERIVYRSTEPLGAVISGAEPVSGWKRLGNGVWCVRVHNSVFGDFNPYITEVYGDWYFAPSVRHAGAVYLNDRALYEAESLEACIRAEVYEPSWEPEFSIYKWYSEQDGEYTVIYANFQDKDPNEENVEINVRRRCFFPSQTGIGYISLSGFNIMKAATTWAPPAAFQDGMVGPHWSKGWIIEDCEISNSKCCGISLGKYYDPDNDHYFTRKHVKSPTQMERDAVCRGQYHGWLKEKIGSHIVRRCHIHHCEQAGIVGRMGCVFSRIEDNHIHHINNMQELGGAEISGIKLHAAIDVTIAHNHIHHSTMGIWCDWQAQGTRISRNLLHDNQRPDFCEWAEGGMMSQDVFAEVGHGPLLIDHNVMLSKVGLRFATEGVALVHNLILGAFTAVGEGTDFFVNGKNQPRYTPYHIPHRTEVAGFMTILHGDNRFYNNIFVQAHPVDGSAEDNTEVGTHVFDGYPSEAEWIQRFDMEEKRPDMWKLADAHFDHLPIWASGNAYLLGAKAWKQEKNFLLNDDASVFVRLAERDGRCFLDTNFFDYVSKMQDGIITSDVLGYAFEPEQRFENPDGTSIIFDRDYFGDHRGIATVPGPFATVESLQKPLF